jgi:hypothetical protein
MRQTISVAVVFLSYLPGIFTGEGNVYASFREKVQIFFAIYPFSIQAVVIPANRDLEVACH